MNAVKRLIDVSVFLRGIFGRRSTQLQQITETKDTSSFPICEAVFKNELRVATYIFSWCSCSFAVFRDAHLSGAMQFQVSSIHHENLWNCNSVWVTRKEKR